MGIYFDNAATMEVDEKVIDNYASLCKEYWYNPSSASRKSAKLKNEIQDVRDTIKYWINAKQADKIIFTSGGTEANNLALKGFCCDTYRKWSIGYSVTDMLRKKTNVFISAIEHPSVEKTCTWLYEMGIIDSYIRIPVLEDGSVDLVALEDRIRYAPSADKNPVLVSIMLTNNEIGGMNYISDISKIVHKYNGVLHVDAVQAFGHVRIDVRKMGVDMLSVSGHKFGTSHGIGFLYVKDGIEIDPLLHGGGQEYGLRSGTENAPSILQMGDVVNNVMLLQKRYEKHLCYLNYVLTSDIVTKVKPLCDVSFNNKTYNICNIISLTLHGIDNEKLITMLDTYEDCQVSAGSACHAGTRTPSSVLYEIGLDEDEINNTIRISFNYNNTEEQVHNFVDALVRQIKRIQMLG